MLTRRASYSSSLIATASTSHHRNVATKLAPKWTQPSLPSTSSKPAFPAPDLGKWAIPSNNLPSAPTGANSPGKWALPDLKPAAHKPSSSPSYNQTPRNAPTSRMPQAMHSSSLGKWARPPDLSASQRPIPSPSSPSPVSSPSKHTSRGDPRLEHDRAPHQALENGSRFSMHRSEPAGPSRDSNRPPLRLDRAASVQQLRQPPPHQQPRPHRPPRTNGVFGSLLAGENGDWNLEQRSPRQQDRGKVRNSPTQADSQGDASTSKVTPKTPPASSQNETLKYLEGGQVLDDYRSVERNSHRDKYKSRGSLRYGGEIERRPRVSNLREGKERKLKQTKKVHLTQDVHIPSVVSVGQLARLLDVRLDSLKRKMVRSGMGDASSYDHVLNSEYASMLALEFNKNPVVNDEAAFDIYPPPPHPDPSTLPERPPVVTIMGHVDHGKTTLLDTLRSASVAKGEAGGITQHIGAFSVPVSGSSSDGAARTITFLDTPGHAAFSAMRARGASVTDIVVLVVAADDGVMPQTKEVIELIKKDEGKVGVVVAINKIDKPGVDAESIQNALLAEGMQLEAFGGEIPSVEVSGLTGQGLDKLVETISAVAEISDFRAEEKGNVFGYVLESKVLKGLGPVATVLILRGDLTPAKHLISGTAHARVRHLSDSTGKTIKAARPGMAVTVSGWKELPNAGDEVMQGTEADIKKAIANRRRRAQIAGVILDAEAINTQRRQDREKKEDEKAESSQASEEPKPQESGGPKTLRLVLKADVSGSVEAVMGALQGIGNNEATVKIVQGTVGDVTESDVMMAKAAEGIIVAFSVAVPRAIETLAASNDVPIVTSSIIYRLMDDIKAKVIELLPPIIEKRVTGEAAVLQLFEIQLKRREVRRVAGCRVTNGLLEKSRNVRVVRNGITIHEGIFHTLRHHKKDMQEIRKDMECGLSLQGFEDLQEGDIIQTIQIIQKPGTL